MLGSIFEITSLGSQFALTRWVISVVGIIIMANLISRTFNDQEIAEIYARHSTQ